MNINNNIIYFFFKKICLKNKFQKNNINFFCKNAPTHQLYYEMCNTITIFSKKPIVSCFFWNLFDFSKKLFKKTLKKLFLKKLLVGIKIFNMTKNKKIKFFIFFNKFLINFLESFFKKKLFLNLKKGSSKIFLKQMSFRKFSTKYFKKNLKTSKQIIGVLYYTFLLKDATIFVNFFRKVVEGVNIKLHKKLFLGLKKIIKDLYKPVFNFFGLLGVFFNIKGKIGVSGSAKKRRYFFFFGKHSITKKTIKIDIKYTPIWTFTGTLGFSFLVFF